MTPLFRPLSVLCFGLLVAVAAPQAQAQNANEAIDISAEESLEWHQEQQLYIARGKAKAIRDGVTVEADLLTAHQRDPKSSVPVKNTKQTMGGDVDIMTAEGSVRIHDGARQVFGEKAVYDLDAGTIKITGNNLKFITDKDIVTAKDSLEYYEAKKTAVARGHAIGEHSGNRVEADTLSALFAPTVSGQLEMTEMVAKGDVTIVTKDGGISRGNKAVYDVKKNAAVLSENVRITRGNTQLAGDKALVDFATGQSRLVNSGSGRVRALLPASGNKKEKTSR